MVHISPQGESKNSFFFILVCGLGSLTAVPLGQADTSQPAEAKSAPQQERYAAYWLTKTDGNSEYRMLLITRMPLPELAKLMNSTPSLRMCSRTPRLHSSWIGRR